MAVTPVIERILPFTEVMKAILRSFWYLRNTLLVFCAALFLNSLAIFFFESPNCPQLANITPKTYWEALYITVLTAVSTGYKTYAPLTVAGKISIIFDSLLGFILLGLVVWAVQHCFSTVKVRVSKYGIIATDDEATIN
jgi:hypothetical protein